MSNFFKYVFLSAFVIGLSSCEEELKLPDNTIQFESGQLGFASNETELTININFSRATSNEGAIEITAEPTGVEYGAQFTTEPAMVGNKLTIPVAAGATGISFKIIKPGGVVFLGDEQIKFLLSTNVEGLVIDGNSELLLTFAELIATSGAIDINGGGANYPNKVFIDFSANRQAAVDRTTWDLGFSSGGDFRAVLNSSNGMMAMALDKTDLNAVTAADTIGMGAMLSHDAVFAAINLPTPPSWVPDAINWIDDPSGDLAKTAIAGVSATASENKVYIVNRGSGPGTPSVPLGWKKIRIIRNGTGYTLQYADIAATTFSEVQVTKDTDHSFQYVSFATGVVEAEPATARWDIAWTGFSNATNFGAGPVPYYFQDFILQNTAGVETAQVLTADIAYEDFTEANLGGTTFSDARTNIGSSWRSGGGPGGGPSLKTDRFYVVKDADDNYYKVRFTALTIGGERGKPKLEYDIVKNGK